MAELNDQVPSDEAEEVAFMDDEEGEEEGEEEFEEDEEEEGEEEASEDGRYMSTLRHRSRFLDDGAIGMKPRRRLKRTIDSESESEVEEQRKPKKRAKTQNHSILLHKQMYCADESVSEKENIKKFADKTSF